MSDQRPITGVILAAGAGVRLRPLSNQKPKPLLPVCNKSIIQHQIEFMKDVGITRFFIVVGHLGRHIMESFGNGAGLGVQIHYVIQDKPLGIAHAVYQLEGELDGPFMLALGDIFFVPRQLETMIRIFRDQAASGVLAVQEEERPGFINRNFTVELAETGQVTRVIEKPRFAKTKLKGCGIYLFDQHVFDAIRRTPRTAMRDEYEITTSIQILVDDGMPVYPASVISWDMNMTVPCDLLGCNLKYMRFCGMDKLIGERVTLPQGTRIENSVIGDDVVFEHPISVKNSLITPHTRVKFSRDLESVIISGDEIIQCADNLDG